LREKLRDFYGNLYDQVVSKKKELPKSIDYNKKFQYFQKEFQKVQSDITRLSDKLCYRELKSSYYRCKILSFVTLGKKHRHYQKKKSLLKDQLREIRAHLRSK
jgi:hypothetical protein